MMRSAALSAVPLFGLAVRLPSILPLRSMEEENASAKVIQPVQVPDVSTGASSGGSATWLHDTSAIYAMAMKLQPIPDKFVANHYEVMYGTFLEPLNRSGVSVKMLEIGLGCDMKYGPGASVNLWKSHLPNANIWFAEHDGECVAMQTAAGKLNRIQVVVGDQGDPAVVNQWIGQSGGQFDVIVDDGGHHNAQIMTSFELLWPQVRPGGLYFIEDMHVGRWESYSNYNDKDRVVVSDIIQAWVEQLVTQPSDVNQASQALPVPTDIQFILCQYHGCALGKSTGVGSVGMLTQWPDGVQDVYTLGKSLQPLPEKLSIHSYQTMYGIFIDPIRTSGVPVKMLEIGLGCEGFRGASVPLWKKLLPNVNLWIAEANSECVDSLKASGQLDGVGVVVGDQGDAAAVEQWIQQTGGWFDVIVDDGGHHNIQIMTSFQTLWPQLKPGGLYFIEGLQVGRSPEYSNLRAEDSVVVSDVIQAWIEQLVIMPGSQTPASLQHDLPHGLAFVFCQSQGCVIGKGSL